MSSISKGSGNVFRDLGLPQAELLQAKADLAHRIAAIIEQRHITQTEAARILGVSQPKVSALLSGRIDGFSMDRLLRFLAALDQQVRIEVSPRLKRAAAIRVA